MVLEMRPAGAPVVGWPLLWALRTRAPPRLLDPGFGPDAAIRRRCGPLVRGGRRHGRRRGLRRTLGEWQAGCRDAGAALCSRSGHSFPVSWSASAPGRTASWFVDVGLHLYTEPLSTALVVGAVALLLRPAATDLTIGRRRDCLGYATVVKLSDGVIAIGLVRRSARARRWRQAALLTVGGLVWAPLALAYWDKGYVDPYDGEHLGERPALESRLRGCRLGRFAALLAVPPRRLLVGPAADRSRCPPRTMLRAGDRRACRSSSPSRRTASTTSLLCIRGSSTSSSRWCSLSMPPRSVWLVGLRW